MVSAGVCFSGKGRLHFVDDKAKINADYYINSLLPKLVEDCETLIPDGYTFQQDGAPAHTSRTGMAGAADAGLRQQGRVAAQLT